MSRKGKIILSILDFSISGFFKKQYDSTTLNYTLKYFLSIDHLKVDDLMYIFFRLPYVLFLTYRYIVDGYINRLYISVYLYHILIENIKEIIKKPTCDES